jgi:small conductance mechanosensitive channel
MNITVNFILIALIGVIAVAIGLMLRHFLVLRLKKTILDNWIVQLLGVVICLLPLIVATFTLPFLLQNNPLSGQLNKFLQSLPTTLLPDITKFLWQAILSVFAIVVGVGIGRTVMKLIVKSLSNNRIDINLRTLIGRISFIIIMIFDVFWLLLIWGIAIDIPVVLISAITVTFTIAFQDILKNLVAGFYILMERPFYIGDSITISNTNNAPLHTGVVENIELRATKLRISSGEQVAIPNIFVFGGVVINNSFYDERRATISVALPIEGFDKEEALNQIIKALKGSATVAEKPEPTAIISSYTGKQVVVMVRFWVEKGKVASISEVMYTLRTALPDADMSFVESAGEF